MYNSDEFLPQVFSSAPPIEMTERFHDVLQFSSHAAKLMVSEIKKRATNLSTGEPVITENVKLASSHCKLWKVG